MSEAVAIDLPLEPDSARRAREHLEPFRKALDETTFFDLRLLVSELVVEALKARSESDHALVKLRAKLRNGGVRVEVAEDGEAFRLPPRRPKPGEAGFGIYLVTRLSRRWVVASRSEPNWAKAAISRYCASSPLILPATCFIAFTFAAEPTRDTERPTFTAGRMP